MWHLQEIAGQRGSGWRTQHRALLFVLLLALTAACGAPSSPDLPADAIRVTGTVHFNSLEGGFWVVRGDDAVTYDPMNGLPAAFQVESLRVVMVVKVRKDVTNVHMAGPIVEILQIQRL